MSEEISNSRVYIKIDSENRVIQIEGEYSLSNFKDLSECILVEEGPSCDRLNHAQNRYLEKPIYTEDGVCQYKWTGTEIVERTQAEMDADTEAVVTLPTAEERLAALEAVMLEMMEG